MSTIEGPPLTCEQSVGASPKTTQDRTWTKDTEMHQHPVYTFHSISANQTVSDFFASCEQSSIDRGAYPNRGKLRQFVAHS